MQVIVLYHCVAAVERLVLRASLVPEGAETSLAFPAPGPSVPGNKGRMGEGGNGREEGGQRHVARALVSTHPCGHQLLAPLPLTVPFPASFVRHRAPQGHIRRMEGISSFLPLLLLLFLQMGCRVELSAYLPVRHS